jgi:tetratricopeptide (TPR) repeat protein
MEKTIPIFFKRVIQRIKFIFVLTILLAHLPLFSQNSDEMLRIQAQQQMDEGKFGEAINMLHRYISANPQNAIGYNLRGLCYENRKEYEKAVYDFRSALKLDLKNKTLQENFARTVGIWESLLFNRIVGYKREIAINPDKPVNYLEIGRCYKNLGNWAEAEIWYDKYLKKVEPSADELIRYSEILAKNNHISKGKPWLKKYTERYPDDHRLWSRYGYFTMWLGKKQIAIDAFEKALELRPFFKEALDGYDLARGKGYVYTVNDTTVRYNFGLPVSTSSYDYAIDKYYKRLIKDPNDSRSRILLVEELINNNRFSEAEKQLQILKSSKIKDDRITTFKNDLEVKKESYYWQRVNELEKILSENPSDEKSVIELAHIFARKKDFEGALNLLSEYKAKYFGSENILYNYALISSWSGDLEIAYRETEKLLNGNPDNVDYKMLFGQLSVWLNKDLSTAQQYLENVLYQKPSNIDALLLLSSLHMQKNELSKAQFYLEKASELIVDDAEIRKFSMLIEQRSKLIYNAQLFTLLEEARKYLFNKECEKSIELFKKYLSANDSNSEVKKELAEAYLCKGDYVSAISIYDELVIENPNEFGLRKHRAKLLYWNGDYYQSKKELYQLSLIDPDDAEIKLFLGDSYTALKEYSNARQIYSELLEISPSSFILKNRMSWIEGPSASTFPTYLMLSPEANYFVDNFDFLYSTYGLRFDFGVTEFLSLGVSGYAGVLGSDSISNNISIFKGTIATRFSKLVTAYVGLGTTLFPNNQSSFLAEASVKIERPNVYFFSTTFYSMDAAQLLYSPFLVDVRLRSNMLQLQGNYITTGDWKFSGLFSFITVSDENRANKLQLRFGKLFQKTIGVGYEYYYYDVKDQTVLYWSPNNFESHSIWVDWNVVNNDDVKADIGGKIGYIPSEEFVLREIFGTAIFKLSTAFSLQTRLTFGSTVQSGRGYSSTSFGVSAFWAF